MYAFKGAVNLPISSLKYFFSLFAKVYGLDWVFGQKNGNLYIDFLFGFYYFCRWKKNTPLLSSTLVSSSLAWTLMVLLLTKRHPPLPLPLLHLLPPLLPPHRHRPPPLPPPPHHHLSLLSTCPQLNKAPAAFLLYQLMLTHQAMGRSNLAVLLEIPTPMLLWNLQKTILSLFRVTNQKQMEKARVAQ